MRRLAAVAAILGLGAGVGTYLHASKSVTLIVDGASQHVSTMDRSVGDLLRHRQMELAAYDQVIPAVGSSLRDGMEVVINFARPIYLNIDGVKTTSWSVARSVDDALLERGISKQAWVSWPGDTQIAREGITIDIRMPKTVSLTVNRKKQKFVTTAANVDQMLQERGITLAAKDRAVPALTTPVTKGMSVKVVRVYEKLVTKIETVDYPVKRIADKTMLEGKRVTKVRGSDGRSKITYRLTFADGKVESKKAIKTVVLKPVKPGVVVYGTKKRTLDQLNWYALAMCESRNNPKSVSRNKLYYGLFQFSLTAWKSVGGSGKPSHASREEQIMRAKLLYQKRGASPWPHCGRRLFS